MQTVRLLTEVQLFKKSVKVLETIVAENDEIIESWYLLAFALVKLKKYQTCIECCKNVRDLAEKLKVVDKELEAATLEIYQEAQKNAESEKEEADGKMEDEGEEGEDDGFVTVSEEEVSSEEGEER